MMLLSVLYHMRKKGSQQKEIRLFKQQRCGFCSPAPQPSSIIQLPLSNLKRKHYYPQVETYHYRTANNFIYDSGSLEAIQIAQMTRLINRDELIEKYFPFSQIFQVIHGAVHRRLEKDFYGWIDFQEQHYTITNNYYIRRKQLVQHSQKMHKILMNGTIKHQDRYVHEYFEKKIRKELDNNRLVKGNQNETNSSTIDLQKLTRNLDAMIGKIADLSVLRPMHPQLKAQKGKATPQKNISQLFKLNSCKEISVINKNQQDCNGGQVFQEPQDYQQSYGLDTIKPKHHHNKGKKVNKMSLRSIDRVNGFQQKQPPQTPKPRFFHAGNEYQQIEQNKPGRTNRLSVENKWVPMSPGNNKSSSLSQSKTLSRKSSQSMSRRKK